MIRTLIVEDEPSLRTLFRRVLTRSDAFAVVAEAENGREGVARAAESKPDVVVLDIKMPVMNGLEALPQIRRVSPDSHVVMLSMLHDESMRREALRLGAKAFLDKSLSNDLLVRNLLDIVQKPTPVPREAQHERR